MEFVRVAALAIVVMIGLANIENAVAIRRLRRGEVCVDAGRWVSVALYPWSRL